MATVPSFKISQQTPKMIFMKLVTFGIRQPDARHLLHLHVSIEMERQLISLQPYPFSWIERDSCQLFPGLILQSLQRLDGRTAGFVASKNWGKNRCFCLAAQKPLCKWQITWGLMAHLIYLLDKISWSNCYCSRSWVQFDQKTCN